MEVWGLHRTNSIIVKENSQSENQICIANWNGWINIVSDTQAYPFVLTPSAVPTYHQWT